jgi:hypothetical protein
MYERQTENLLERFKGSGVYIFDFVGLLCCYILTLGIWITNGTGFIQLLAGRVVY